MGVLLFVWLIMMGLLVVPKPNQASSDVVPKKISRGAWVTAQDGQKSDVIVLLNEQASVIVANQFANRQEKNAYVFDTLYETALDSQNALRDWLNKKGIAHHAFYIVNALQLQADADLLVALSERDDVKRVITNPQI